MTGLRLNTHRSAIVVVADDTWLPPVEAIVAQLERVLERLPERPRAAPSGATAA
jgi:hypothetical protein